MVVRRAPPAMNDVIGAHPEQLIIEALIPGLIGRCR
jgi:hypothetical protein